MQFLSEKLLTSVRKRERGEPQLSQMDGFFFLDTHTNKHAFHSHRSHIRAQQTNSLSDTHTSSHVIKPSRPDIAAAAEAALNMWPAVAHV